MSNKETGKRDAFSVLMKAGKAMKANTANTANTAFKKVDNNKKSLKNENLRGYK